jgi:hypothetical protein
MLGEKATMAEYQGLLEAIVIVVHQATVRVVDENGRRVKHTSRKGMGTRAA